MTNFKATKRALGASILSIVLCISMLVGTTFAWFTDVASNTNNRIVAGNLDISLWLNEDGAWKNIGDSNAVSGDIFNEAATANESNDTLWEPGKTQIAYLKVQNDGNLALKYQIQLNVTDKGLAGALVYDLIELANENDVVAKENLDWTTFHQMAGGRVVIKDDTAMVDAADATITAPEEHYYALVVHMMEDADNKYNVKNNACNVVIDLTVLATQLDNESDAFGKDYDEEAVADGALYVTDDIQYVHANGEHYLYKVNETYAKDTLVIPEGVTAIANYAFYYNNNVKTVVMPSTMRNLGRGFDSSTVETVVLNEGLETISNRAFKNTANLKSVNIPSTVTTIEESAFQSSGISSIVIPAGVTAIDEAGLGYCPNLETIIIEGDAAIANYAARGCASLKSVYLLGENVTFGGTSMAFSNAQSGNSDNITIYVDNATVEAAVKAANGSCTGYTVVLLDDSAVPADGILKPDAAKKSYSVLSAEGLTNLETVLNGVYLGEGKGATIELMADIDLSGEKWDPIDNMWVTFNGNGHTISNLTTEATRKAGLFGYAGAVTINDLTLENVTVIGSQAGAFAGAGEGLKVNNCYLKGTNSVTFSETEETWNGIGAITGVLQTSTVNVEIVDGATVTVDKNTMTTDAGCVFVDNLTGYIKANKGTVVNNGKVTVKQTVSNTAGLAAAIAAGAKTVSMQNGDYELKGSQADGVTLIGLGDAVKVSNLTNFAGNGNLGAIWQNMNFENVIFTEKVYTMADGAQSTFTDCTFEQGFRGGYSSGTGVVFDGCTFYDNDQGFAMHFEQVKTSVTVTGCNFVEGTIAFGNGSGTTYASALVTFDDCTFSGESTRTEYFDAWASAKLIDCKFTKATEIYLQQSENGETVTLENTTGATVVEK